MPVFHFVAMFHLMLRPHRTQRELRHYNVASARTQKQISAQMKPKLVSVFTALSAKAHTLICVTEHYLHLHFLCGTEIIKVNPFLLQEEDVYILHPEESPLLHGVANILQRKKQ